MCFQKCLKQRRRSIGPNVAESRGGGDSRSDRGTRGNPELFGEGALKQDVNNSLEGGITDETMRTGSIKDALAE
jgi:hypothetical protein